MKYESEVKNLLITNAIHLIAKGGFEMATTKELTHCKGNLPNVKMNEVYIYRLFGSKEHLFEAAFVELDEELHDAFWRGYHSIEGDMFENTKDKCLQFFDMAWRFIMKDEERCRCYIRYLYSIYFKGKSLETHKTLFAPIIEALSPLFKEEADVPAILHSVFMMMFDFAIRVYIYVSTTATL